MKHSISILSLLLCVLTGFSQTDRGRYLIGGSIDMSTISQSGHTNFSMNVGPQFGVFVVNNFAVAGFYSFGISTSGSYDKKKEYIVATTFTTSIGPKLSYYIGKKPLKGLVSVNGGYRVYTQMRDGDVTNKNGFTVGGFLGMAYFFNPHVALNAGAYTTASGYEGDFPTLRIGFSVGFSVLLDKKKKE